MSEKKTVTMLSVEDCRIIIQNSFKTTEFTILDCDTTEAGSYDSFLGKIIYVSMTVKQSGKEQPVSVSFFVKQYPEGSGFQREFVKAVRSFYKETHIYGRLLNKIDIKGKVFPKCFYWKPDEFLVLENLAELGFVRQNKYDTFGVEECEMTLSAVAKLHAASVVYEESHETRINRAAPNLIFESLFVTDAEHPGFHNLCVGINAAEAVVDAYFQHVSAEACDCAYAVMRRVPQDVAPSKKWRNVLNHGHLWSGNIMFCRDIERRLEDVRLVDLQSVRYCPPAVDVLLLIHLTSSRPLRDAHTQSLLVHYYNALGRELADNDIDVRGILTWDQFKRCVEEVTPTVLALAILYLQVYLLPRDKIEPIITSSEKFKMFIKEDRSQLVLDVMRTDENYRKRISQAVSDLLEYVKND